MAALKFEGTCFIYIKIPVTCLSYWLGIVVNFLFGPIYWTKNMDLHFQDLLNKMCGPIIHIYTYIYIYIKRERERER